VTTGVGFFNTTAIQIGSGFAAAATVPPGQTEFAFAYDLPYTGTTLSVPFKAEYPTAQVVTLVPPNVLARTTAGVAAQGIVTAFGSRYQVYTANNVAHDGQITVNLYDLPQPGEAQDLNTTHLLWLAGALLALLALLLALYVWRGALGAALGLIPAARPDAATGVASPDAEMSSASSDTAERDRLLRALLALEQRQASGSISVEQFKRERAPLRERLRALLADEPTVANPAASQASPADVVAVDASAASIGGKR
jgi:hypothetical protein